MRQKYIDAVEYLIKHPDEAFYAWGDPDARSAGCLFQFANQSGSCFDEGLMYGCLTQVACGHLFAFTRQLTQEIRADKRLCVNINHDTVFTRDQLMAFAEWQDRLDTEIRGIPQDEQR